MLRRQHHEGNPEGGIGTGGEYPNLLLINAGMVNHLLVIRVPGVQPAAFGRPLRPGLRAPGDGNYAGFWNGLNGWDMCIERNAPTTNDPEPNLLHGPISLIQQLIFRWQGFVERRNHLFLER